MPTRIITLKIDISYDRPGYGEAYHPMPIEVNSQVYSPEFTSSLTIWRDRAVELISDKYYGLAIDGQEGLGSLKLSSFNIFDVKVFEDRTGYSSPSGGNEIGSTFNYNADRQGTRKIATSNSSLQPGSIIPSEEDIPVQSEVSEVPEAVYAQIEMLRKKMERAGSYEEYMVLKNELNRLMTYYRLTNI